MGFFSQITAAASGLALFACSAVGVRDTEEPKYRVLATQGQVEIREYGPRIAAETVVEADEMNARSAGFRRIAGYIFGDNRTRQKIAMTAPVAQDAPGQKISMTAPVSQDRTAEGGFRIRFFMPAGYTLDTLPVPDNPLVTLAEVPPQTMAVLRFAGSTAPETIAARTQDLLAALQTGAWQPSAPPVVWFYDPPWTIPALRRNEVAVQVSPR